MNNWFCEIGKWTWQLTGFKRTLWDIYIGINMFVSTFIFFYPMIASANTDSLKEGFKIPVLMFVIQFSILFLILIIGWQINK